MKTNRGMGFCFQPQYVDKKTGERKTAAVWWISFSHRGRRCRESSGSINRNDAIRLLKQRIADVGAGKAVGPQVGRVVLDDLIGMLVNDYVANDRRSLNRVQQGCAHLREFFGADHKAIDLTPDRATRYQVHRLEEGAARASINYELGLLARAFRLAVKAGKVAVRPEFTALQVNNARSGFFEVDQYLGVLDHLPDHLKPVIQTAYITGWRTLSEILTRRWKHVDLVNGWLRLDPNEGKTREPRAFPLTAELRAILEEQRERVRALERETGRIIPDVFITPSGGRIKNFRKSWASATRAAGVPGRLVHDLRRTAVRNLERAGVPRSAAMAMTGHRSETIYRRYAIVEETMLQEASLKLAALHLSESSQSRVKVTPLSGR